MTTTTDNLAEAIRSTEDLLARFLEGFDETSKATQGMSLPNHLAWTLGHLALTMHRAAERIADSESPLDWDPEPYAFGSTPLPDESAYPTLAELMERFRRAMGALCEAVRTAGDEGLDRTVSWGRSIMTAHNLAVRMVFHNGMHAGQLVDLRRALGMGPVIR